MNPVLAYLVPGLRAAVVLLLAWGLGGWLRKPIDRVLQPHMDATLRLVLVGLVRPALVAIALPAALDAVGVSITSVIALLSTVGLAIALSLKGSLSNVASGAILLASRPFEVGDHVSIAGVSGRVRRIDFLFTILETDDGHRLYVPNDKVIGTAMERHAANGRVRSVVTVRVARARLSPTLLEQMYAAARSVPGAQVDDDSVLPVDVDLQEVRVTVRIWSLPSDAHAARSALFVALNDLTREPTSPPL